MAHAAVPTAAQLSHFILDLEPVCKFCSDITRTSDTDDDTSEIESEYINHYFWACPRIKEFWRQVSCFLQDIHVDTSGPIFQVDLQMVATGFGSWSKWLPNTDILHGLAVWEIYRACAELSLSGIKHSGEAMYLRWKATLMLRIVQDFTYSFTQLKAAHSFYTRWLLVSNRWYHFDPGENELSGKLSFQNSTNALDGRQQYDINSSQTIRDADTSSVIRAPISNVSPQTSQDSPRGN
ncbi:hypothetical protein H4S07_000939 [Coemansia furcata]|uniref:Uncharacterized protein n=1 Tax=Coemansia furcata TaxID=417177 RepID=A0ACC1LQ34_9FUNG|nr:hypothetical protein H4S07_000939 [Coemansia furcata]